MKKTQQTNSRRQAQRLKRQQTRHLRLNALWMTLIVSPLKQARANTRANRLTRIAAIRMED